MSTELARKLEGLFPPDAEVCFPQSPDEFRRILVANGSVNPLHVVVRIASLHRFIQHIEYMQAVLRWDRPMIFRGHSNYQWKLIPSLMRNPIFTGVPSARQVDELERELLVNFRKRALPFVRHTPSGPDEWWEWTALAQHHKLPTRLLDWSYKAGTALYFAMETTLPQGAAEFACVWAIKAPRHLDTNIQKYPHPDMPVQLYDPPHVSPRIIVQQGCFTVHPGHYLKTKFEWIDGPRVLFLVNTDFRRKVLDALHAIGMNRASIYPDLDGISIDLAESIAKNQDLHKLPHDHHGDA